jgi:hypothetical protein
MIPPLGIYPAKCKSGYNRDTCMTMISTKLFKIALCNMRECVYSTVRKSDTMWYEGKWMQLNDIMLGDVIHVQKEQRPHVFSHI